MIASEHLIGGLLLTPVAAGAVSLLWPSPRGILATLAAGTFATAGIALAIAARVFRAGPIIAADGWFHVDALSAWHLAVMLLVFSLSALYAPGYFGNELKLRRARPYAILWSGALAAMALVLVSNNLGILWVGIEASTLLTAFLISIHRSAASLEAMWKYLLICSVGVAFAFMGTLFVAASTNPLHLEASDALLWTRLRDTAPSLDATFLKAGFLFLLVGYGTKAGLAPMHTWLPDAHSQAPSPVSAVFSGFMLNTSLYCILRYVPIVEAATGRTGWSLRLLVLFGLVSILIAAGFITFQKDVKRLLAYSSVEHLGIMTLGVGLGGAGAFAALFHMLNHSIGKTLAFFSAGRVGQMYGTHDMGRISGAIRISPVWGIGLLGSVLALIGAAPFAIFMSEFQIVKAAVDGRSVWTLVLFLFGIGVAFIGALRPAIGMVWGEPGPDAKPPWGKPERAGIVGTGIVAGSLAALLFLGLWIPRPLWIAIHGAAKVIGGAP